MKNKQFLLKLHFGLLIFVVLNFIVRQLTNVSLNSYIILAAKILILLSGLVLFFLTIKPFEKKSIYFSIYLLSPLAMLLSFLIDRIFWAIISSIFLSAIMIDDTVVKSDNYEITQPFSGFIGVCCNYSVKKNYFHLAEKTIGHFTFDDINLTTSTFTVNENNNTIDLNYKFEDNSYISNKADTLFILNLTKP